MKNEFVPYDIALAMTQVGWGWHEGVMGWYCNTTQELRRDDNLPVGVIYAPLYQQAFRWFREKYNMQSAIKFTHSKYSFDIHFERLANGENPPVMVWHLVDSWLGLNLDLFKTYEEAQDACLRKLIDAINVK